MKIKINVNKAGYAYLPKDLRDGGYEGEIEAMPNHFTVALFKPGSTIRQRRASLLLLAKDLENQMGESDEQEGVPM